MGTHSQRSPRSRRAPLAVAVLGAGALGCLCGAAFARAGFPTTLIERDETIARTIAERGVRIKPQAGRAYTVRVPITTDPATVGPVDLLLVCVRYWQTEGAVRAALPSIGPDTTVLTLQSGWGDAELIAGIVGSARTAVGLTAEWAASDGPGRATVLYGGATLFGGYTDDFPIARLEPIAECLDAVGFSAQVEANIREVVWHTLATDACALPLCAILSCEGHLLIEHAGTVDLMRAMQREIVAVANADGPALAEAGCWRSLYAQLARATDAQSPLFQEMRRDLRQHGRSDIDRLNGAVVAAGQRLGIPTPYNESVLWLIRAQERRDDGIE